MQTSTALLIGAAGIGGYLLWQRKKMPSAPASGSPALPMPASGTVIQPPSDLVDRMVNAYRAWQKANTLTAPVFTGGPVILGHPLPIPPAVGVAPSPNRAQWVQAMQAAVDPRLSGGAWGYLYDQGIGRLIAQGVLVDEATAEKWFITAQQVYPA